VNKPGDFLRSSPRRIQHDTRTRIHRPQPSISNHSDKDWGRTPPAPPHTALRCTLLHNRIGSDCPLQGTQPRSGTHDQCTQPGRRLNGSRHPGYSRRSERRQGTRRGAISSIDLKVASPKLKHVNGVPTSLRSIPMSLSQASTCQVRAPPNARQHRHIRTPHRRLAPSLVLRRLNKRLRPLAER